MRLMKGKLITIEGVEASMKIFIDKKSNVLAGLRPQLIETVKEIEGSKLLPGYFTSIQQAIGTVSYTHLTLPTKRIV